MSAWDSFAAEVLRVPRPGDVRRAEQVLAAIKASAPKMPRYELQPQAVMTVSGAQVFVPVALPRMMTLRECDEWLVLLEAARDEARKLEDES